MPRPARILIVDDSRIFRAEMEKALASIEDVTVVGSVYSGEKALEFIRASAPDMVTLDVEMPGMDGLETLKAIQQFNLGRTAGSEVGVLMVSALTKRGADVTVQALRDGAFDFIAKPAGESAAESLEILRRQLRCKIHVFLAGRGATPALRPPPPAGPARQRWAHAPGGPVRAVLIAASTGGPRALQTLLPELCGRINLPMFVVQHMPAGFTRSLAEQLALRVPARVIEAVDGDPVRPGTVYFAPGDHHLVVRQDRGQFVTGLTDLPPENGSRPAADVLFRSAAAVFGGNVVAVVLTGMLNDGTAGLRTLKRAGAYAIAQDEATSVVWGMPGSAVAAGLADEVLPLGGIAAAVESLVVGRRGR
jgi:two-component system chemotaxis response regulator CheB